MYICGLCVRCVSVCGVSVMGVCVGVCVFVCVWGVCWFSVFVVSMCVGVYV